MFEERGELAVTDNEIVDVKEDLTDKQIVIAKRILLSKQKHIYQFTHKSFFDYFILNQLVYSKNIIFVERLIHKLDNNLNNSSHSTVEIFNRIIHSGIIGDSIISYLNKNDEEFEIYFEYKRIKFSNLNLKQWVLLNLWLSDFNVESEEKLTILNATRYL